MGGIVAAELGPDAQSTIAPASGSGTVRAAEPQTFVLAGVTRVGHATVHRADRSGSAGRSAPRDAVFLLSVALLAIALAAFVGRQRRRSRPPIWHGAALLGRGPPLLVAA